MASIPETDDLIQLAVIGAAQGLRGEVRVKTYTGDPMALGEYGPLYLEGGRSLTVKGIRPVKNVVVVRFAEISSRTDAEAMNGQALFVERSKLPADLDDDEYYHADLVGLEAKDETGRAWGRVAAVHNFGAGDILELDLPAGGSLMVPFTPAAVTGIDFDGGVVHLDRLAAGLEEDGDAAKDSKPSPRRGSARSKRGGDKGPGDKG